MSLVVRDLRRLYCWLTIHYCPVIASFWNHCPVHSCQFWSSNNKKNFVSVKLVWVQWLQTPVTVLWWPKHWCYQLRIFWINLCQDAQQNLPNYTLYKSMHLCGDFQCTRTGHSHLCTHCWCNRWQWQGFGPFMFSIRRVSYRAGDWEGVHWDFPLSQKLENY